ncbi:MAG: ABC transporter substrate-binding protein [Hyphomicrobiales bacterium]|nr:ABC transporter substrate-binding protein [Hyphomicrobiales bacterium]MCA1998255.1 ABC transporter substrate-binding protein [Hyphomicrobiales bacterium]
MKIWDKGFTRGIRGGFLAAVVLAALPPGAAAQEKVRIGLLTTLSGPAATLGQQSRDAFLLAVKTLGGKLGGLEADIVVVDDELKPDVAVTRARGLVERDKVDFVVGPIFSNILIAIHKPVTDAGAFLISPNAGTSNFAGRQCHPNFFVASYQNDQNHEVMGKYAQDKGFKKVFLLAPNYQAGKDSLAGFKRHFKGEIVGEEYVPLNTADFSGELAKIAAAKPDAFFTFMPGGLGVNLVRQYHQAGLASTIPFLSAFTVDESTLPAQKEAALGFFGGSNWAPDMKNAQSEAFVTAYEAAFGTVPGSYAMHGYDAALLIDAAIRTAGGKVSDRNALRAGLRKADFTSLRGDFRMGANHYPVQDFYVVQVVRRPDGKYATSLRQKVFDDYVDAYAKDCQMRAN